MALLPHTARPTPLRRTRLPRPPHPALLLLALPLLLLIVLPLLALLLRVEPALLLRSLTDSSVVQAVGLSLFTSTATTLLAVLIGTPAAYLLARSSRRGRTQALLETLVELPIVLPPAVAGVALLMAFGRRGLVGAPLHEWGLNIAFSPAAVVLAQLFVASPLYVKSAIAAFGQVPRDLEDAAALDGAAPPRVFRHITLPLAGPLLSSGAVMTWARALGEFGATIIFAGNYPGRTRTMPLAIYIGFELSPGVALTLAALLLAASAGVLVLAKWVLRPRSERQW